MLKYFCDCCGREGVLDRTYGEAGLIVGTGRDTNYRLNDMCNDCSKKIIAYVKEVLKCTK